jgi:predicted secreted protein
MKVVLRVWALVPLLVVLAACSSTAAAPKVEVSCDEFAAQPAPATVSADPLDLETGDTFTVSLCSNPTTGYSWSEDIAYDTKVLKLVDRTFEERADASPPVVGAAGREQLTFEAIGAGSTTVVMTYSRPWEENVPPEWTFELPVVVK